jgi:hypothetical protein
MRTRDPEGGRFARRAAAMAVLLALGACIQGPWDYYPSNPPSFRGIFVSGYVIAVRPIRQVCFERMLGLQEEATEAFPFYDSADVRIGGSFGLKSKELVLTPLPDTPNCFVGDSAELADRNADFSLTARFVWDSAGRKTVSVITGTAHVPEYFKIHTDAAAPSIAKKGGIPPGLFRRDTTQSMAQQIDAINAFVLNLPPEVLSAIPAAYVDTLTKLANDTAAAAQYLAKNGKALQGMLFAILQATQYTYDKGDTVTYLNGDFNTLSHYFSADRSPDVKAVLITQRFDSASGRPETSFDNPLGGKRPDSGNYYFPGNHRRLLLYPDAKGPKGWKLLDSMGIVNVWFHTGLNRFFFYGVEQAYYDFHATNTQVQGGGGPSDGDPRIKPKYNVKGGAGFFTGAAVDSFDVNVVTDKYTYVYPLPRIHALSCDSNGWYHNRDCRDYYRPYCAGLGWKDAACGGDAVRACLEADLKGDAALKAGCDSAASAQTGRVAEDAVREFCVENDYPASQPLCAPIKEKCGRAGANECKWALWGFCKDNNWRQDAHPQCGPALAWYCKDLDRPSEIMCSRADDFCRDHPEEAACK